MLRIGGLSTDGRASQFWFAAVSNNYFTGLGVAAEQGTLFTAPSGSPVHVVLGHTFWMKTFGGDPGVIGKTVRVDGSAAVITGVVAKSFRGTLMGVELDGYVTLDDYGVLVPDAQRWLHHNRKARPLQLFARLRPGVRAERSAGGDRRVDGHSCQRTWRDRSGNRRPRHPGTARAPVADACGDGGHSVRAVLRTRSRRRRSSAGMHERREPAARSRDGSGARDGGSRGTRRQPGKTRQADGRRGPSPFEHRRRGGLCGRSMGHLGLRCHGWTSAPTCRSGSTPRST